MYAEIKLNGTKLTEELKKLQSVIREADLIVTRLIYKDGIIDANLVANEPPAQQDAASGTQE